MIHTYGDDKGGVALIDAWGNDKRAVHAARVSFSRESDNEDLTARDVKLLKFMIKEGHTSPFEHSGLTMKVVCPLFVRSQIMRHRTFSFNEVSRRYTSAKMDVYVPSEFRLQSDKNLQCSVEGSHATGEDFLLKKVSESALDSLAVYEYLLRRGVSREQARGVLPQNMYTMFWMSGNLHNWFKFLKFPSFAEAETVQVKFKSQTPLSTTIFDTTGIERARYQAEKICQSGQPFRQVKKGDKI